MNSFTLTAVGNLARNPEAVAKGDITYTRFCLVGNDYAGKDDEGALREIVTTLWFVAFGPLAESLVRNTRKGDQLILEARVRANNWTDKQGEKQHDLEFIVQGFRFGAPGKIKREERDARRESHATPDSPVIHDPGVSRGGGANHSGPAAHGGGGADRSGPAPHAGAGANHSGPDPHGGGGGNGNGSGANDDAGADQSSSTANSSATANPSGAGDGAGAGQGASGSSANSGVKTARGRRAAAPPP